MSYDRFIKSLTEGDPNAQMHPALKALWYDKSGDWETAHQVVQDQTDPCSALIHGYLHRKEGDEWNARYWYNRAGRKPFKGSLDAEWLKLARELTSERNSVDLIDRNSKSSSNDLDRSLRA